MKLNMDLSMTNLERKLQKHLQMQADHREYENMVRGISKIKSNVLSINSDHMSKKFLVKLSHYTKKNFKLCTDLSVAGRTLPQYNKPHKILFNDWFLQWKCQHSNFTIPLHPDWKRMCRRESIMFARFGKMGCTRRGEFN